LSDKQRETLAKITELVDELLKGAANSANASDADDASDEYSSD